MYNIQIIKKGKRLTALTIAWRAAVLANGGALTGNSLNIMNGFTNNLVTKSYYSKLVYLLPLLGAGIAAAVVPLLDTKHAGKATNTNFVDGDFSETAGLQGNGSSKILAIALNPSQIGTSNNGGFGWWESNVNYGGTSTETMGMIAASNSDRFVFDLRSNRRFFSWGNAGNAANQNTVAPNGHYYGQRTSVTNRELYLDGSQLTTNSASDAATGSADRNLYLMGSDDSGTLVYWAGRCSVAYLTDGTLTTGEAADLDTLLRTYLVHASGKT